MNKQNPYEWDTCYPFIMTASIQNICDSDHYLYHLHPEQEDEEHPPQPELPDDSDADDPLADRPMPNRDIFFSVLSDPHFSHATKGFDPNTSFSNSALQAVQ
jgi:hypothetical protein